MLTKIQEVLIEALRAFMTGEKYVVPAETDWRELFKESTAQAVALVCLQGLDESSMPQEVRKGWQNYAMRSLRSNIDVHAEHAYVHELLTAAKIPYVTLKGSCSAYYYPDPLMRAMGDVDFWTPDEYLDEAYRILRAEGWESSGEWEHHHIALYKDRRSIELHRYPAGIPEGEMGEKLKEYFSGVFAEAKEREIAGNRFVMPSDFHHGLIILLHTYHHVLLGGGIGFRHLCDWAIFVRYFEDEQFAKTYEEKLSAVGLWKFVQILSYICHVYLGIPYREWMGKQEEALCLAVIEDIFVGGNFGKKEADRTTEMSMLNLSKGKGNKFFRTISWANGIGRGRHPRLAKIPLLRSFFFIPVGIRYVFRVLTGKRKKLDVGKIMDGAGARQRIYDEFHLFEVEKKK